MTATIAARHGLRDLLGTARAGGPRLAIVLIAAALAAGLGLASAEFGAPALIGAVVILLLGVATVDLTLIPMFAMPMSIVQARAGGVLTYADVILAVGSVVGLFILRNKGAAAMQPLIWGGVVYLAVIIPTLILNPFSADFIEWAHELFMVIGSMVIGFVIGREGRAPLAFGLYVVACGVLGVIAGIMALQHFFSAGEFEPVYVNAELGFGKNQVGGECAVALVIAYARPKWLRFPTWFANLMVLTSAIGLFASQARQGMIGALIGVAIVTLRPIARGGRRRKWIWLAAIPVVYLVWTQSAAQLASDNKFNSAYQRLSWYSESIEVWQKSPIFGVGLRWWYTNVFTDQFQPPNAELEVLSCVGVVGLIGFFVMFIVAMWFLLRLDPVYGTLGAAAVMTRFTQTQLDLYWVSGLSSLLWIVAAAGVGVMVRDRLRAAAGPSPLPEPIRLPIRKLAR
ncbi:O-antigen ligase family protein [Gryllotalpicola ginsengisoli]|uniref:O-antigen ligase family protein n=1 Tax=Gryllotalpicola ginsengisoli TaxID=444608 RepID=UPI0003B48C41|nr:O-antigen ligase family protein [Gryllotalpicola ginsengisoli]